MKLKVIKWHDQPLNYHECQNEEGSRMNIDLFVNGDFSDGTDPKALEGEEVEVEWLHPYVSIAHNVKVVSA